jgi:hypothetical protein
VISGAFSDALSVGLAVGVSSSVAAQPERVSARALKPATKPIPRNFFIFLLVVGSQAWRLSPTLDATTLKQRIRFDVTQNCSCVTNG